MFCILKKWEKILGKWQNNAAKKLSPTYRLLNKKSNRFVYRKHAIPQLEIHVTHKCTLHCAYCTHYCDIGYNHDIDCEIALESIRRWSERLSPLWFRLLGGEPFMEKRLPEFIQVAAQSFPNARRDVVSNAVLISNWDDSLPKLLKKTGTAIWISEHPMTPEQHGLFLKGCETARRWQRQYDITLNIQPYLDDTMWRKLYQGDGKDILPFKDGRPEESRHYCHAKACTNLHQGKLWQCPPLAYLPLIADKLTNRDAWEPYLRYRPLDLAATDFELAAFLRQQHGIEFCAMCPSKDRLYDPHTMMD